MTTIAYHHESKTIAVDGRIAAGNTICSDDFKKWLVVGEDVWFISGAVSDYQRFIDYHHGKITGKPEYEVTCSAIIASAGRCYEAGITPAGEVWKCELGYSYAKGSGSDHALSAMDMGADAKKAVEMAIKRDSGSGGKISEFCLSIMKFTDNDDHASSVP